MTDHEDEIRRLRGQIHRLEDDKCALEERLGYAWRQVEELRSRALETKHVMQTATPVEHAGRALVPVTAAELEAVLARLRDVKPLPVA